VSQTQIGARMAGATFANGTIAEVGVWNVALAAADFLALSKGISPLLVRPDALVAYWPLIGHASPEIDLRGRNELTVTGATQVAHPRIMYPPMYRPLKLTTPTALTPVPFMQDGLDPPGLYRREAVGY
jgi:hypothetical protein